MCNAKAGLRVTAPANLRAAFETLEAEAKYIEGLPQREDEPKPVRVLTAEERQLLLDSLIQKEKELEATGDPNLQKQAQQMREDREKLSSKYIFVDLES
jgi:hypothetical protein